MSARHTVLFRELSRLAAVSCLIGILHNRPAHAATPSDLGAAIEQAARKVLSEAGVPSASIAVIREGSIAFLGAYGDARLSPRLPARPEMRYGIGSISKQFTAAALLLLAEDGALSLDDKVARFLPKLLHGSEVTIRQLLSHTSGYQDFWPQDYVMPTMLKPTDADGILSRWASLPLDFAPGTRWQYSNTNFVIAGLVIEKASGMPFLRFLKTRVLQPLGLNHVADLDNEPLGADEPTGYTRYGLGPPRPAPRIGSGWLFAMGQLAMTAEDLARWDLALMEHRLLKPSSESELTTETRLQSGVGTGYGLGIAVTMDGDRRLLEHSGEISGFCAENMVFPEQHTAIVVLTNRDATHAATELATALKGILFDEVDPAAKNAQARDRRIFEGLQHGKLDHALFTDNANHYFSPQAVKDFQGSLGPLGAAKEFKQTSQKQRGGMLQRVYKVKFAEKTLRVWSREMPDGKLEEFLVAAVSRSGE
jgi:CubicO group peptidase (beta-lactamase class C family)